VYQGLVVLEWRVVFLECGVVCRNSRTTGCRPHVCLPIVREAGVVLQLPLDLGTLDFIARKRPRHISTRGYRLSDRCCRRRGGVFLQTELFLVLLDEVCVFSSGIVRTGRVRGRTRSSSVAGAIVESSMRLERALQMPRYDVSVCLVVETLRRWYLTKHHPE
jgi:hypothetical protein